MKDSMSKTVKPNYVTDLLSEKVQNRLSRLAPICCVIGVVALLWFIVAVVMVNVVLLSVFIFFEIPLVILLILGMDCLLSARLVYRLPYSRAMTQMIIGIIAGVLPILWLQMANSNRSMAFIGILALVCAVIAIHIIWQKYYLKDTNSSEDELYRKYGGSQRIRAEYNLRNTALLGMMFGIGCLAVMAGLMMYSFAISPVQSIAPAMILGFFGFYFAAPAGAGITIMLFVRTRKFKKANQLSTSNGTVRMCITGGIICLAPASLILVIMLFYGLATIL